MVSLASRPVASIVLEDAPVTESDTVEYEKIKYVNEDLGTDIAPVSVVSNVIFSELVNLDCKHVKKDFPAGSLAKTLKNPDVNADPEDSTTDTLAAVPVGSRVAPEKTLTRS